MPTETTPPPESTPEPIDHGTKELLETAFTWGTIAAAAGGAMLFATTFSRTRLSGSTHSSRIEWSRRQAEIQQVAQAEQTQIASSHEQQTSSPNADSEVR